jgi:hypothetical protein
VKNITPFILILLLALCFEATAWARLGETESAVAQRYGRTAYKLHRAWGDEEKFSMNGFSITVTFIHGVSVGELFESPGHIITDEEMVDLLAANSEGHSWSDAPSYDIPKHAYPPVKQMWVRPNGSTAVLTASSLEFKSISLLIAQEDAAKQRPAVPSTAGF